MAVRMASRVLWLAQEVPTTWQAANTSLNLHRASAPGL